MVLVTKKQKNTPTHHRKRNAKHHKRNDEYHKPYWPYLPLLGIIGFGFLLNILWTPLSQVYLARQSVLGFSTNMSIPALLAETNSQRSGSGAGNLTLNSQLNNAAQAKANDMAARDYWSHETPEGGQPWQFILNAGYAYTAAGENLAYGFDSSTATVTGWMNSPGHRANLLNGNFRDVGFGIANAENYQGHGPQTIVVALYGSTTATANPAANTPTPQQTTVAAAAANAVPPAVKQAAPDTPTPSSGATATDPDVKQQAEQAAGTSNSGDFSVSMYVPEQPQRVARMELVSTSVPSWSIAGIISIVVVGTFWFLSRHMRALHRTIVHGEQFIVHHVALDVVVVSVVTIGILATRTAGFIQ